MSLHSHIFLILSLPVFPFKNKVRIHYSQTYYTNLDYSQTYYTNLDYSQTYYTNLDYSQTYYTTT
jgi:hypothetical protein